MKFGVSRLGFGVQYLGFSIRFRVEGRGFRVSRVSGFRLSTVSRVYKGLGFRVSGFEIRVSGLGVGRRVQVLGFRV